MENKEKSYIELDAMLLTLRVGEPGEFRNLKVFPIFSSYPVVNGYTLLDDAVKTGKFVVKEVSEAGSVPNLKVINQLDEDVLILDGEALVGAKQNRIVNTTIIIGKMKEVVIPVSCVEQGRWRYSRSNFRSGDAPLYSALRMKKSRSVTESLRADMSFRADQNEIWDDIAEKSVRFSVNSDTHDMHDIYKDREEELKKYEESFNPEPGQTGFVAVINNEVVGCDIFGRKNILPRVYKKLLKGYILDALDRNVKNRETASKKEDNAKEKAELFLDGLKTVRKEVFKSAGEGEDIRLEDKNSSGFALVHNNNVIHIAAFAG